MFQLYEKLKQASIILLVSSFIHGRSFSWPSPLVQPWHTILFPVPHLATLIYCATRHWSLASVSLPPCARKSRFIFPSRPYLLPYRHWQSCLLAPPWAAGVAHLRCWYTWPRAPQACPSLRAVVEGLFTSSAFLQAICKH